MQRVLNVDEVIDREPLSRVQIRIILLCGLVVALDGYDAQCIGYLAPAIAETFGVPVKQFGPVFSAGLIGLMLGALFLGPVADHIGRRWTIIASTVAFGLFSLLTICATSLEELTAFRFFTGLGLGGALPNLVSLATEYSPKRLQGAFVAWLFAGIPVGAILGGIASTLMLPTLGWKAVFFVGGITPLLIAFLLVALLPESVRFLIGKGADAARIATIMIRIAPLAQTLPDDRFVSTMAIKKGMPVRHLFTDGRALGTIRLWIPYFMNLLIIYFVVSWLPAVLREAGFPLSAGIMAVTLFSIGGAIGCLVTGRLVTKFDTRKVLLIEFGCGVILIIALAVAVQSYWAVMITSTCIGIMITGAQAGLNALVAKFYPTFIRSTGVGWALGIGRIGSITGPLLGGVMLSMDWSVQAILMSAAVPAICAAISLPPCPRDEPVAEDAGLSNVKSGEGIPLL